MKNGCEEFLVSWKGYNSHANRWVPKHKIVGLHNLLVDEYLKNLPLGADEKSKKKTPKSNKPRIVRNKPKRGINPGELIIL